MQLENSLPTKRALACFLLSQNLARGSCLINRRSSAPTYRKFTFPFKTYCAFFFLTVRESSNLVVFLGLNFSVVYIYVVIVD